MIRIEMPRGSIFALNIFIAMFPPTQKHIWVIKVVVGATVPQWQTNTFFGFLTQYFLCKEK